MRFIHLGSQALLAFTTILSGVASAPTADTLPALSGRDVDSGSNLAKRGPPTKADFDAFFASEPQKSKMSGMVYWSGTGPDAAEAFAKSKGRQTLEMLIGDNWLEYQNELLPSGKLWAKDEFWDPASAACAEASTGEVYVLLTFARDIEQQQSDPTNSKCDSCWYQQEKPNLISGLGGRITKITKYLTISDGLPVGQITSMGDKI